MRWRLSVPLIAALLLPAIQSTVLAGDCCGQPASCCECVERTVMVPTWVTETRKVMCTEYRPEQRQQTITVYKSVPEHKTVERQYTVMVPKHRTKTVKYTACKTVWEEKQVDYTVMVPHQETRHGTRTRCECVPVKETRTVCKDKGHWEERQVAVSTVRSCCYKARRCGLLARWRARRAARCGATTCCQPCSRPSCCEPCQTMVTKKVWVPNVVQEQVEVTVMKPKMIEEPYEYTVTVCKPETRTKTVKVCKYVPVEKTREVSYVECVPETRTKTCTLTSYKCVPEEKTITCTVMVPHQVEREVQVRVCRMVPKQVTCCRPSCGGCCH